MVISLLVFTHTANETRRQVRNTCYACDRVARIVLPALTAVFVVLMVSQGQTSDPPNTEKKCPIVEEDG